MLDNEIIESCVESCKKYKASIAAVAVKDTIKVSDDKGFAIETPDRSKLYQVQTPQSFTIKLVYDSYTQMYKEGKTEGVTDDAMVVSAFGKVEPYLTKSSYKNIKVTTPEDLSIAECFLKIK
jgi:2-C-methyl-D-erythritol 4-phosphate cytidylyltransferase